MNTEAALLLSLHDPRFDWGMVDFNLYEKPGAYCIYDTQQLMAYIGSSINIRKRIISHINHICNNSSHNSGLNKYRSDRVYPLMCFTICHTETHEGAKFMEAHWACLFSKTGILNEQGIWYSERYDYDHLESVQIAKSIGYEPILVHGEKRILIYVGKAKWKPLKTSLINP